MCNFIGKALLVKLLKIGTSGACKNLFTFTLPKKTGTQKSEKNTFRIFIAYTIFIFLFGELEPLFILWQKEKYVHEA